MFFLSGASGLVYQVVWTRMAFATFGIISPVLSVVLSVFMLGLAVGSWAGGRLIGPAVRGTGMSAALFYAAVELVIGMGAFAVPVLFEVGRRTLLPAGEVNSARYLALSAVALAVAIFPWCLCMGTTFPLMMAFVRERSGQASATGSFSFLYLANVLGAMTGTLLTAVVLIEALGFRHTLWVAAAGNVTITVTAVALALRSGRPVGIAPPSSGFGAFARPDAPAAVPTLSGRSLMLVLFSSGFASMAMEVVWTRAFAAVLKTQVYSFAMIVFAYLGATAAGAAVYRWHLSAGRVWRWRTVFVFLAVAALLPPIVNDARILVQRFDLATMDVPSAIVLLASICPFCALLGYLTPRLVDDYAAGHPRRAGSAYAVNAVGCILGPLFAAYVVLPMVSGRWALILLAVPFLAFWAISAAVDRSAAMGRKVIGLAAVAAAAAFAVFVSRDFEEHLVAGSPEATLCRDTIASVAGIGRTRQEKMLLVNGFGMTSMTPITKFIAHLPLAYHEGRPASALVICFGMGTSYRSALSWGVDTTAVELVPSVPRLFRFYHADAVQRLADPHGRVVIDDGRRYLARCGRRFDVIVVDPPPPVAAAGSSLLFSTEFYALARQHLNRGGIVQMWYPGGGTRTAHAAMRSMALSFRHVRCFSSVEGWGTHMLGSDDPIGPKTPEQLVAAMPAAARADLMEWADVPDPSRYMGKVVANELDVDRSLARDPDVLVTDDRPFNEYFLLRRGGSLLGEQE
jgi:predicted membrane-bound spermidine synthase